MKIFSTATKKLFLIVTLVGLFSTASYAQKANTPATKKKSSSWNITKFGTASYYANKFQGRKTATGETYLHELYTAACNLFPLNTWIKITNLSNNTSIIARINDRMHPKNKRLVDLSKSAAKELGYVASGLTEVKVEVLKNYHPGEDVLVN